MAILKDKKAQDYIIQLLTKAYWMEIETVMSYIANSVNLDGVRAKEIKNSLQADITEELGHAQQFAARIKVLYGEVPGSMQFKPEQSYLQPPKDHRDVPTVIRGVIQAEQGAIDHYNKVIEYCEAHGDPVTADMLTTILADEQSHLREFEGFLKEYEDGSKH
jgi:bacterioferritin